MPVGLIASGFAPVRPIRVVGFSVVQHLIYAYFIPQILHLFNFVSFLLLCVVSLSWFSLVPHLLQFLVSVGSDF